MAKIDDGTTTMAVQAVSLAARQTLYGLNAAGDTAVHAVQPSEAQPTSVAGVPLLGLNDRALIALRSDRLGSLASALHTPLLVEPFEGTTINPIRWLITNTTMAATQSSIAGLTFNSGSITTATTGYMIQSAHRFLKTLRSPLQAKFRARIVKFNNSVMEMGFGDAATFNGANTTGAYWQVTSGGSIIPVLTFNSSDLTGGDVSASINASNYYTWDVFLDDDEVIYTVQDTATGLILSRQVIKLPITAQRLWSSSAVSMQARLYNTGVAPATAPQLFLTDAYVLALDAMQAKGWSDILASSDRGMMTHPFTGAQLPNGSGRC
jgi:hypothetical protein